MSTIGLWLVAGLLFFANIVIWGSLYDLITAKPVHSDYWHTPANVRIA